TTPHDHAFILPTTGATQPVGTERGPITEGPGKEAGHEVSQKTDQGGKMPPKKRPADPILVLWPPERKSVAANV
ncbi:MAG: hypothetical protein ACXWPK_18675, partial [Isosphaeraceae bacterium]